MAAPGAQRVRRRASAPAGAAFGPTDLAAALQPALAAVAGAGAAWVSVELQFGALPAEGADLEVEAWVDRATRTLVFAAGTVRTPDGALAGAGSAVFRRAPPG